MFSRIRLLCLRVINGKGKEGRGYLYIGDYLSWESFFGARMTKSCP